MRREGNLTDIYRLIGCFCIVWFHSSYYGFLDPETQRVYVDTGKNFFITWAMLFFYVTSARFGLKSIMKNHNTVFCNKILNILTVTLVFIVIYDLPNYILDINYYHYPFHLFFNGTDSQTILRDAFNTFRTGNYSPLYFLVHLMVYYIIAYLISKILSIHDKLRWLMIVLCFFFLGCISFLDVQSIEKLSSYFMLNKVAVGCMLVGFLYELLNISNFIGKSIKTNFFKLAVAISLPILITGYSYVALKGGYQSAEPVLNSLPIWISSLFLILGDKFSKINNQLINRLSYWGQQYSMGVFVWHFFMLIFISKYLPLLWEKIGFSNPSLILYGIINISGFLCAVFFTHLSFKNKLLKGLVELKQYSARKQEPKLNVNSVVNELNQLLRQVNDKNDHHRAKEKLLKIGMFMKENDISQN